MIPQCTHRWWATLASLALCVGLSSAALAQADLTIDAQRLASSVDLSVASFQSQDCAVVEGLVGGTGRRRLLRFDVATPNIGCADLLLGDPSSSPDLFTFSLCHDHYHLDGYALYELLDASSVVVLGRKQAFCLFDKSPVAGAPCAGTQKFTCNFQGISAGWQDVYPGTLDGQWLDVTGVPPGRYVLRVTINPDGTLPETNDANNVAETPVRIPRRFPR